MDDRAAAAQAYLEHATTCPTWPCDVCEALAARMEGETNG
jgi:hypothetical protein